MNKYEHVPCCGTPAARTPTISRPDPSIKDIDTLLKNFEIDGARRRRVAEAIVHSSRKHSIDPRLVAIVGKDNWNQKP